MKKTSFLSLLLLSCLTCSCASSAKTYPVQDYKSTLEFKDNFLICQINDLHYSTATYLPREFKYLDNLIASYGKVNNMGEGQGRPDLIILNGDIFMDADKRTVKSTLEYFNSLKIPFAYTYGNHDYQGSYSKNYIQSILNNCEYSLLKNPYNDDVYGNANYVIDLKKDEELKFQIYMFDSNSYEFGKYDNIHEDQVKWYEKCLLESKGLTAFPDEIDDDTFDVKNLAFFHIPTLEFDRAVKNFKLANGEDAYKTDDEYCVIGKDPCCEGTESRIMDAMHKYRATVGVGVAHDHYNSTDLISYGNSQWPIHLIYGNKTGDNGFGDVSKIGATFYSIKDEKLVRPGKTDQYFNLTKILVNYDNEAEVVWRT